MQLELFEIPVEHEESKYSEKIAPPLYNPSQNNPHILQLVDCDKTRRLIRNIEKSNVSDEEKRFLIEAAHRHSVFNYSKIADYYCHASAEMQDLMEQSALVIIDFNRAIELGYVRLSENIKKIQERTARKAGSE